MATIDEAFLNDITDMIRGEFRHTTEKQDRFHSAHEGYAALLEEVDELWDEIKRQDRDASAMRKEAIQVGAMAMRFLHDLAKQETPDDDH